MNIRTLTEIEDLMEYRRLTVKYIDVLFPLEYLQQSKIVVCCLATGEFCGGYMIVPQGDSPLRVLDSIPDDEFAKIPTDLSNVAEVTGLWLDAKKADTTFCSIMFWLRLYLDLSWSKYDGFVYAYNVKKKDIARAYAPLGPVSLFRGLTKQLEGMEYPEHEAVEFLGKSNVRRAPVRQFSFLSRRFKMAFKRVSRKKFSFVKSVRLSFVALFKIFS